MKLDALLDSAQLSDDVRTVCGDISQVDILHISFVAQDVVPNTLFCAWKGARHDGHTFWPEAKKRGAVALLGQGIVCNYTHDESDVVLACARPRAVMAALAHVLGHAPSTSMDVVGITGTNGKTTVAHLVASIMAKAYGQSGLIGTLGATVWPPTRRLPQALKSHLTTPEGPELCKMMAAYKNLGIKALAMEASSIALDQGRLMGTHFAACVYTNLSHDHLDYHHTHTAYAEAKKRLVDTTHAHGGTAVINALEPSLHDVSHHKTLRFLPWGQKPEGPCELSPENVQMTQKMTNVVVATPRGRMQVTTKLLGGFNVDNVVAAVGAGLALGFASQTIIEGIAELTCVPGRMQRVVIDGDASQAPLVIVDYAHTPDALQKVLAASRQLTQGRLFCIFGCGGERDPYKRRPMGLEVAKASDIAVVTNDNPRNEPPESIAEAILEGLVAGGSRQVAHLKSKALSQGTCAVILNRHDAIASAIDMADPLDTVLIAGKGHEQFQDQMGVSAPFCDVAVARACLKARRRR